MSLSYIDIVHSLMFNDMISASTIFILLETNANESREFIAAGFDNRYLYVGIALVLSLVLNGLACFRDDNSLGPFFKRRVLSIPISVYPLLFCIAGLWFLNASFLPFMAVRSVEQYHVEKALLNSLASDPMGGDFTNVTHFSEEDEVYILIIGESTTRQRMGLYGYERDNNPLLTVMADDLVIYTDVISPHTHTISALNKVLTTASFDEGLEENNGSIIQLFNKAGFKTYWISNQCPIGLFESSVTALSNSCDRQVFLNANQNTYDEVLFPPFQKVLQENESKKLIIMHLMGTHLSYNKRYPSAYDVFHDQPKTPFAHEKAYTSINTYDNAVLYNDFIVNAVINELRRLDVKSSALYLSDHGEEVFMDKDFAMHAEYDHTQSMYDIPFLMWFSENIISDTSRFVFDTSRSYNSEDIIFTMADLAGIRYDEFDATKSLVNSSFVAKKRLITDKLDYDEEF